LILIEIAIGIGVEIDCDTDTDFDSDNWLSASISAGTAKSIFKSLDSYECINDEDCPLCCSVKRWSR